ncbi:hypothetical protein KJ765_02920 [Candidatus Micrarchaeota archaeon]|nr:hypothetical protein [Candidatus Micrarchaeota archaeon]
MMLQKSPRIQELLERHQAAFSLLKPHLGSMSSPYARFSEEPLSSLRSLQSMRQIRRFGRAIRKEMDAMPKKERDQLGFDPDIHFSKHFTVNLADLDRGLSRFRTLNILHRFASGKLSKVKAKDLLDLKELRVVRSPEQPSGEPAKKVIFTRMGSKHGQVQIHDITLARKNAFRALLSPYRGVVYFLQRSLDPRYEALPQAPPTGRSQRKPTERE